MAGYPWGNAAKMPFSVRFSVVNNRKSPGHRPVDPRLSRRVSQGHRAGVLGIFLSLCALFFPDSGIRSIPAPAASRGGAIPLSVQDSNAHGW